MTTLPNSTIVKIFLSSDEQSQLTVANLIEQFFSVSLINEDKFTFPELSIWTFGNKYSDNYQRTRYFVHKLKEELQLHNKSLVEVGLANIYNEGLELKSECEKMGRKYRTGGAYLFTTKMLGLLLLSKNEKFREFVRGLYDNEGQKFYVPFNLESKKTNTRKYVLAYSD